MVHVRSDRSNRPRRWLALAAVVAGVLAIPGGTSVSPAAADGNDAPGAPTAFRSLSVGLLHSCAIVTAGSVRCWGANTNGALGLGDTADRGDAANEMGAFLPPVDLGAGRTATAIAAGTDFTCARLDNATVKCWGDNAQGQLGQGDSTDRGDAAGEMGDSLPAVSLGTGRTATTVAAGRFHTCARLDNGQLKCWGFNLNGRLGLGNTADRGDGAGEMGNSLPAVTLGTGRTAAAIAADDHTCAVLDNGSVKCWGDNTSGALGAGDTADRGDGAGEMGDTLVPIDLGSAAASGVSGTVTDAASAAPVAGTFVVVMRTTDFSLVTGAVANGSGNYSAAVPPGSYFLYLVDPTGAHTAGFFGPPTTVTVPADTVVDADPTMAPTRGSVSGTVTETGPNTAVPGAFALALSGTTGAPERGVVANGSGAFTMPGLNPGNHFVGYIDPTGNHATRFFPNSPDVPNATPVAVTAGSTTAANGTVPTQTPVGTGTALTGTVSEQGTATPLAGVFVLALRPPTSASPGPASPTAPAPTT